MQLGFLSVQYPLTAEIVPGNKSTPSFKVTVTVLLPSEKAKAFVTFVLDSKTYMSWPMTIDSLQCEVEIAYGNVE